MPQNLALSPRGNHRRKLFITLYNKVDRENYHFICRLPHPSFTGGTAKPVHLRVQLKFIAALKIEGEIKFFISFGISKAYFTLARVKDKKHRKPSQTTLLREQKISSGWL